MQAIFDGIKKQKDDFFCRSVNEVSINIKSGLNFNNIFTHADSPTGNLIDYNIRVIMYNFSTVGAVIELALAIFGINIIPSIVFAGVLFFVRHQMKQELDGFWFQRAAHIAIDNSVDFVNKATQLYDSIVASSQHEDLGANDSKLITGKKYGPFGIFKAVTSVDDIIARIKSEAKIDEHSEEEFQNSIQHLPASTTLFLSLLKINDFLQKGMFSNPLMSIQQL